MCATVDGQCLEYLGYLTLDKLAIDIDAFIENLNVTVASTPNLKYYTTNLKISGE